MLSAGAGSLSEDEVSGLLDVVEAVLLCGSLELVPVEEVAVELLWRLLVSDVLEVVETVLLCGSPTSDTTEELSLDCSTGVFPLQPVNCAVSAITTNADINVFFIYHLPFLMNYCINKLYKSSILSCV